MENFFFASHVLHLYFSFSFTLMTYKHQLVRTDFINSVNQKIHIFDKDVDQFCKEWRIAFDHPRDW